MPGSGRLLFIRAESFWDLADMDKTEWIVFIVVGLACAYLITYFIGRRKKGGLCDGKCPAAKTGK